MENWGLITGRGAVYEYVIAATLRFVVLCSRLDSDALTP